MLFRGANFAFLQIAPLNITDISNQELEKKELMRARRYPCRY
jgi:hypothetical protein